jgi:hypothetical protein
MVVDLAIGDGSETGAVRVHGIDDQRAGGALLNTTSSGWVGGLRGGRRFPPPRAWGGQAVRIVARTTSRLTSKTAKRVGLIYPFSIEQVFLQFFCRDGFFFL